jgi:hypothetical protein
MQVFGYIRVCLLKTRGFSGGAAAGAGRNWLSLPFPMHNIDQIIIAEDTVSFIFRNQCNFSFFISGNLVKLFNYLFLSRMKSEMTV